MNRYSVVLLLIADLYAAGPSASEILARANRFIYAETSVSVCEVRIERSALYEKMYKMKFYNKGRKKMLAQFLAPAREVGRALLANGDIMRLYLPTIAKSIRISPEQLFMGSDFTHGDLLQLDLQRDYAALLVDSQKLDTDSCFVLELSAQNQDVAYAKIKFWIRQRDYLPLQQEFYSLSGKPLKILKYSDQRMMAGILRPTVLTMTNLINPQDKTVVTWLEMETGVDLADYLFTQQYLEKQ
jgi:outer membrane lipoprotein-sorting protein